MKKLLVLGVALLGIVLVAGCGQSDNASSSTQQASLAYYYETKDQNLSNVENKGVVLGLKQIALVTVPCVDATKGVTLNCDFDIAIFSEEALHAGEQEFYFAQEKGVANSYYGPFTGDLLKMLGEGN